MDGYKQKYSKSVKKHYSIRLSDVQDLHFEVVTVFFIVRVLPNKLYICITAMYSMK